MQGQGRGAGLSPSWGELPSWLADSRLSAACPRGAEREKASPPVFLLVRAAIPSRGLPTRDLIPSPKPHLPAPSCWGFGFGLGSGEHTGIESRAPSPPLWDGLPSLDLPSPLGPSFPHPCPPPSRPFLPSLGAAKAHLRYFLLSPLCVTALATWGDSCFS